MKKVVTGANGYIGSRLVKELLQEWDILSLSEDELDVTVKRDVEDKIYEIKPNTIIHLAAAADVEWCERNEEKTYQINVEGTKNIVSAAKKINARVVYVSSDYIFDGEKGMYEENDKPNPINVYGKTKLEVEQAISRSEVENLIIRTSSVYGWSIKHKGFAYRALESIKLNEHRKFPKDQYACPTLINDLIEGIRVLEEKKKVGIWQINGPERISRYEFAKKIARQFGYDVSMIHPANRLDIGLQHRPRDSSLKNSKDLIEEIVLNDIEEGVKLWAKDNARFDEIIKENNS